jgi:hypothetical protein
MKSLFAIIFLITLYAGCGSKNSSNDNDGQPEPKGETNLTDNKGLIGSWGTIRIPLNDKKTNVEVGELQETFTIQAGYFTQKGKAVILNQNCGELELTSPANLTDSSVEMLVEKSDQRHFENNGVKCDITLATRKGKVSYQLQGDSLIFIINPNDPSKNIYLNRL